MPAWPHPDRYVCANCGGMADDYPRNPEPNAEAGA